MAAAGAGIPPWGLQDGLAATSLRVVLPGRAASRRSARTRRRVTLTGCLCGRMSNHVKSTRSQNDLKRTTAHTTDERKGVLVRDL